jgi:DNA processing protein
MVSTRFILALLELPGIGRRTLQTILKSARHRIEYASELVHLLKEAQNDLPRLRIPSDAEMESALQTAENVLRRSEELELVVIGKFDSRFPKRLNDIPDPPVILFVRGNVAALSESKIMAVIGTREPSIWAKVVGERLSKHLAESGVVVVSGLADGCDTVAHRGCLKGNGKTVAVLAHGLHTVYPAGNRELAEEIVVTGGCLVSEYAPDVRAQRSSFVERDRLQSGLSQAVLVLETDIKGGTMHTVKACLDQGRILACLSHLPKFANDKSRGNAMLIGRGDAVPVGNTADLNFLVARLGDESAPTLSQSLDTRELFDV